MGPPFKATLVNKPPESLTPLLKSATLYLMDRPGSTLMALKPKSPPNSSPNS